MTPSEQAQVDTALRDAYTRGFHDARHYPHRRQPTLHIHWGQHPHLTTDWGDTGLTPVVTIHTRDDGTAP